MKCFRYFSFVLFALLGVFFGSFIINQNSVSALSDISITVTNNTWSSNQYLCTTYWATSDTVPCSGYKYLYITDLTYGGNFSSDFRIRFLVRLSSGTNNNAVSFYPGVQDSFLFEFPSSGIDTIAYYNASTSPSYPISFVLHLSENNPYISGITPSGSIELTENGTYDVAQYAEAVVNVLETDCPPSSGGDYHNDLVAINNSIIICAATCLVIYFFYCIYRMIIKNSGVK